MKAGLVLAAVVVVSLPNATVAQGFCDAVEYPPEGGNPVGTWTLGETLCAEFPNLGLQLYPDCDGTMVTRMEFVLSGTVTFVGTGAEAESAYSRDVTTQVTGQVGIPMSCVEAAGRECAGGPSNPAVVVDGHCVIGLNSSETETGTGTWALDGGVLRLRPDDSEEVRELRIFTPAGDDSTMWVLLTSPDSPVRVLVSMTKQ